MMWTGTHGLPSGKSIVSTEHGIGEIDVNAPNVDEDEFAPVRNSSRISLSLTVLSP